MNKGKLTQEELEAYSSAHKEFYGCKNVLGDILIQEEHLKTHKQESLVNYDGALRKITSIQSDIISKYGEVKVNLTTGELS